MMEFDAIRRAMDEGVPDGPDARCGTCALWDYKTDVWGFGKKAVAVGVCERKAGEIAGCLDAALAAATGECDGTDCPWWREHEG